MGQHGDRDWRVGIQHPRKPGPIATLELHDGEAIGTSGDYQRYFEFGGKRYCHLIDPRSGQPVQGVCKRSLLLPGVRVPAPCRTHLPSPCSSPEAEDGAPPQLK
ncbi:MAG: FAD:protein FMN transferase [Nitrosomonadales bacterium]